MKASAHRLLPLHGSQTLRNDIFRILRFAGLVGLSLPSLTYAAPGFPSMQIDIPCMAPAAPLGDQGGDCSKLAGTTQVTRITFYTAQIDPLFAETKVQAFDTNGVHAYL